MTGSSNRRANGPILPVSNVQQRSGHRHSTGSNRPHSSSHRQSREQKEEKPAMSAVVRGHFVAMSGEFVGTTMFLLIAFAGTQIANSIAPATNNDPVLALLQLLFISMSFGFSLAVNVWVFFRISGGLFNPAVSKLPDVSFMGSYWLTCFTLSGHSGPLHRRCCPMGTRCFALHPSNAWWDRGSGSGLGPDAWRPPGRYHFDSWNFDRTRPVPRDVLDSHVGHYRSHARR